MVFHVPICGTAATGVQAPCPTKKIMTNTEQAASRAVNSAHILLTQAFQVSGKTVRELAKELSVSEIRVESVLGGYVRLNIEMLARYLCACGYRLEFSAVGEDGMVLPVRERRRQGKIQG